MPALCSILNGAYYANNYANNYANIFDADLTGCYQTSQLGRNHHRETINLYPNVEPFAPIQL